MTATRIALTRSAFCIALPSTVTCRQPRAQIGEVGAKRGGKMANRGVARVAGPSWRRVTFAATTGGRTLDGRG